MKKHLANIVSFSRIVGAVGLFFCNDITAVFLSVYIFCGFTDLIDGPIARKTGSTSTLGASLDTVGDVATYLALTKILIKNRLVPKYILIWILSAGVLFGGCALVSRCRFKKLYLPHTYLGKFFGFAVFILPVCMKLMSPEIWMSVICGVATIHAAELFIIQLKNEKPQDFVPWVFSLIKRTESGLQ